MPLPTTEFELTAHALKRYGERVLHYTWEQITTFKEGEWLQILRQAMLDLESVVPAPPEIISYIASRSYKAIQRFKIRNRRQPKSLVYWYNKNKKIVYVSCAATAGNYLVLTVLNYGEEQAALQELKLRCFQVQAYSQERESNVTVMAQHHDDAARMVRKHFPTAVGFIVRPMQTLGPKIYDEPNGEAHDYYVLKSKLLNKTTKKVVA